MTTKPVIAEQFSGCIDHSSQIFKVLSENKFLGYLRGPYTYNLLCPIEDTLNVPQALHMRIESTLSLDLRHSLSKVEVLKHVET